MKPLMILLTVLVTAACTTLPVVDVPAIRGGLDSVDQSDGINEDEARILAQNYMLDHNYDYDWDVTNPKVETDEQNPSLWAVTFPPLEDGWGSGRRPASEIQFVHLLPYFARVDKQDGSISIMKIGVREEGAN